ncbi:MULTISPECIES: response regulator transcription factor [Companilactobacillus]|jgi:Response regulators consisting of a CheY-like receiver domain and a winged-helix DNA-binding domain|uniref:OmpR family DNA-binding response regulator n=4 Tax=Companilactobacillus TaxID=2767879 RepID=A0A0R1WJQ6_9LACO|nr:MULTISPECIES: response regulator transcription factor [Companilactobacillus]ALB29170.1 PhoB family transcriptional regulator [Companilactobacillus heilongjiangensis]AYE38565.1 response regulator transcription factor [Companilactobacillus zhachilii]KRM15206.1 OmpR family DNA-binding response regulator [Companilactobacillus nantensis DSM 16982]MBL3529808.1 response regulator transcription factor [Companilactobacillus zhachilii]GEO63555.1 DNA-binding response regulator [Companilactobacillus na
MAKILVIEDEENMAKFVQLELQHENYEVTVERDGRTGLEAALSEDWDLILLDLMLPELNGIEVCRRIRQEKNTPIIMMTARDSIIDRVSGLDHGADDYIVKPFAIEELLARIRALLRRIDLDIDVTRNNDQVLKYKNLVIDKTTQTLKRNGEVIDLTRREYDLLSALMENVGTVLSRDDLLERVWGTGSSTETNVVDVYIKYLRNKIDRAGAPSYISTVRGKGYVMRR